MAEEVIMITSEIRISDTAQVQGRKMTLGWKPKFDFRQEDIPLG